MVTFDAAGKLGFDPLLGTVATLMAARELGRRSVGTEIEAASRDLVLNRFESGTGARAVKLHE